MTERIRHDARHIRKLMREAESVADEAMIAFSRLRQAMLAARQNPQIPIDAGQRALLRLSHAEQQALAMSTNLLRVHDELSRVARETAGTDEDIPTNIPASAIAIEEPASMAA